MAMTPRLLRRLDTVGHAMRWPRWLLRPVCDRYELALGVTEDELRRTA